MSAPPKDPGKGDNLPPTTSPKAKVSINPTVEIQDTDGKKPEIKRGKNGREIDLRLFTVTFASESPSVSPDLKTLFTHMDQKLKTDSHSPKWYAASYDKLTRTRNIDHMPTHPHTDDFLKYYQPTPANNRNKDNTRISFHLKTSLSAEDFKYNNRLFVNFLRDSQMYLDNGFPNGMTSRTGLLHCAPTYCDPDDVKRQINIDLLNNNYGNFPDFHLDHGLLSKEFEGCDGSKVLAKTQCIYVRAKPAEFNDVDDAIDFWHKLPWDSKMCKSAYLSIDADAYTPKDYMDSINTARRFHDSTRVDHYYIPNPPEDLYTDRLQAFTALAKLCPNGIFRSKRANQLIVPVPRNKTSLFEDMLQNSWYQIQSDMTPTLKPIDSPQRTTRSTRNPRRRAAKPRIAGLSNLDASLRNDHPDDEERMEDDSESFYTYATSVSTPATRLSTTSNHSIGANRPAVYRVPAPTATVQVRPPSRPTSPVSMATAGITTHEWQSFQASFATQMENTVAQTIARENQKLIQPVQSQLIGLTHSVHNMNDRFEAQQAQIDHLNHQLAILTTTHKPQTNPTRTTESTSPTTQSNTTNTRNNPTDPTPSSPPHPTTHASLPASPTFATPPDSPPPAHRTTTAEAPTHTTQTTMSFPTPNLPNTTTALPTTASSSSTRSPPKSSGATPEPKRIKPRHNKPTTTSTATPNFTHISDITQPINLFGNSNPTPTASRPMTNPYLRKPKPVTTTRTTPANPNLSTTTQASSSSRSIENPYTKPSSSRPTIPASHAPSATWTQVQPKKSIPNPYSRSPNRRNEPLGRGQRDARAPRYMGRGFPSRARQPNPPQLPTTDSSTSPLRDGNPYAHLQDFSDNDQPQDSQQDSSMQIDSSGEGPERTP